jgi:hypothetical protein
LEEAMPVRAVPLILLGLFAIAVQPARSQDGTTQQPAPSALPIPIGRVETLAGDVRIEHVAAVIVQASNRAGGGPDLAKKGDPVFQGDIVQTGADGAVGIAFTDGTAFNLSSNARMTLDQYVYDPNGKANSTFFNLTKGTFTFVAGKVAKTGDMKIDTPVATMGIRGTAPHVEVAVDGSVKFSTLVEKNKNGPPANAPQRRAGNDDRLRARQASRQLSPNTRSPEQAEKDLDARLKICRGC